MLLISPRIVAGRHKQHQLRIRIENSREKKNFDCMITDLRVLHDGRAAKHNKKVRNAYCKNKGNVLNAEYGKTKDV